MQCVLYTVGPRNLDLFYILTYYKKWFKTSYILYVIALCIYDGCKNESTVCPGTSDPIYIVTYNRQWVTTPWTYCTDPLE